MKRKLTPKSLVMLFTGIMFMVYAAYNVFILIRDRDRISSLGLVISAGVALLFAALAVYMFMSLIRSENNVFTEIRIIVFIVALFLIFVLRLRMVTEVIEFIDFSYPETILYAVSYFCSLAATAILLVFFAFFLSRLPLFPRAVIILPLSALILFVAAFVLEIVLFFVYGIYMEANVLRNIVIRPVFYLGFIGLSAHFLFPPDPVD